MKLFCIVATLMLYNVHARFIPHPRAISKRSTDDAELMDNLSKIKTLLQKLQDVKSGSTKTTTLSTTMASPPELMEPREPMGDNGYWEENGDTKNEAILPKDMATLRELKRILEDARQKQRKNKIQNENTANMDDLGDTHDEMDDITWRDLARKLQLERDQLYIQKKQNDEGHAKVKAITEEGYFLPLEKTPDAVKDEIRASIEKNLMTDLALAFHSGVSVDDIIHDLTERVKPKD